MPDWRIITGDCLDVLATLPECSVQCVVTSPPYWGLRDYKTATWEGGDSGCDHKPPNDGGQTQKLTPGQREHAGRFSGPHCWKCGALRIDNQIGLEESLDAFVAKMVEVFQAVWRVLRDDGTCWINLGPVYINKQLLGIPWRVALALQADGWWLRSDIIWAKPNPMPESCTDRPTKSHEHVFLMTKRARYFYDETAVREVGEGYGRSERFRGDKYTNNASFDNSREWEDSQGGGRASFDDTGRNLRDVWHIATHAYPDAHFATYPPKLVEPCVKAGTSMRGCCSICGAAVRRVVETTGGTIGKSWHGHDNDMAEGAGQGGTVRTTKMKDGTYQRTTTGWQRPCDCDTPDIIPCTVLDPFAGAGTTGLVALRLGRSFIGIELSEEYAAMARKRIVDDAPLFNSGGNADV